MDKEDITINRDFGDEDLEQLMIKLIMRELNSSSTKAEINEKLCDDVIKPTFYQPVEVKGK